MGTPLPPVPRPGGPDPIVFLDVTLGGEPLGRIKLHLFSQTHPLTSENFRQLCTGQYRPPPSHQPLGYKSCKIHRIQKSFIIQSGDILHTTTPSLLGTGTTSIYNSRPFADESFMYNHSRAGLLSMANSGPNTNGCQFFITCAAAPHLDGKHVVFGQVVDDGEGMVVLRKIENVRTAGADGRGVGDRPVGDVRIALCGEM